MEHFALLNTSPSFWATLNKIYDICITVSVILPIYEYVIMYGQYSSALCYNVIHPHLEYVLAHLECKWYSEESVLTKVCVEHCKEWSCFCQVHTKECFVAIHLGKFCSSCEDMCNLPQGLELYGFHIWWPCSGLSGRDKFSACHWPFWGMSVSWPMVWALSALQWFPIKPSLQALFRSHPCTRLGLCIFHVELAWLSGRSWCHTCLTCLLCKAVREQHLKVLGTVDGCCIGLYIDWGCISILAVDHLRAVLSLVEPFFHCLWIWND